MKNNTNALTVGDILTTEALDALTPEEINSITKVELAKEYSGWRRYPSTCAALIDRIPAAWWGAYSAEHIGEVMGLLKQAYDDGKNST